MPIDYAQLRSEIQTDPTGFGYAPFVATGADGSIADLLNQVRTTITLDRGLLPAYQVFEAIVPSEWGALTATERQRIQTILSMGNVDTKGPNTRAAFLASFASGSVTRTNLAALQTREGSRAEQLFGIGTFVSHTDVAIALRG